MNQAPLKPIGSVLIIGGGHAGSQTAAALRELGFAGRIEIITDESGLPYQRPPLSKRYLLGDMPEQDLPIRPASYYTSNKITLRHDRALAIHRETRTIRCASGESRSYDHLVLATGAQNRRLSAIGTCAAKVYELRTRADADRLGAALGTSSRAVIVGAGFIGLEFAAVAAQHGVGVTVLERAPRAMARAVSAPVARQVTDMHLALGVEFRFGTEISGLTDSHVLTSCGDRLPADLVLVGIGVIPETALAAGCGLDVANGIVVDGRLATADPAISAIGDCAVFPGPDGAPLRLESVQNASDQARALARRLMAPDGAEPYSAIPWFWSDQGEMKLQIAGLITGADRQVVLRGGTPGLTVLSFRSGRMVAAECINRAGDFMAARRLLEQRRVLDLATAAQPGFALKSWLTGGSMARAAPV